MALYHFGGIYLDLDTLVLNPMQDRAAAVPQFIGRDFFNKDACPWWSRRAMALPRYCSTNTGMRSRAGVCRVATTSPTAKWRLLPAASSPSA